MMVNENEHRSSRDPAETSHSLAIETSGRSGSAALGRGDEILALRKLDASHGHASNLFTAMATMCLEHQVSPTSLAQVFVSIGPGSYTGLRIGVTVARMIAFANNAETVAVPSLEAVAQNALAVAPPPDQVVVLRGARRGRVYQATFQRSGDTLGNPYDPIEKTSGEASEVSVEEFLLQCPKTSAVLGEGLEIYEAVVKENGLTVLPEILWTPKANVVYALGRARLRRGLKVNPKALVPHYIKPPSAVQKWDQLEQEGKLPPRFQR